MSQSSARSPRAQPARPCPQQLVVCWSWGGAVLVGLSGGLLEEVTLELGAEGEPETWAKNREEHPRQREWLVQRPGSWRKHEARLRAARRRVGRSEDVQETMRAGCLEKVSSELGLKGGLEGADGGRDAGEEA